MAEDLPFDDDSVDAAMAMVTVHGDALDRLWLADYVPELIATERRRFPAVDRICAVLGGAITVTPVPVPADCADGFAEAFYGRPERFLDPAVRRCQSVWSFVDDTVTDRALTRLRSDLASGAWDRRYGTLRRQPTFVGALRLITALPVDDTSPR
ncbi:hypothetical protein [Parafrankia sp. FMc2]|uniref:hypothetical protein n=1 Tax=Parafrankia sp. FMc2 TaxID=3233196 RepID=UPI0034D3A1C9